VPFVEKLQHKIVVLVPKNKAKNPYMDCGDVVLRNFNLGTRWRPVTSFTLRMLYTW